MDCKVSELVAGGRTGSSQPLPAHKRPPETQEVPPRGRFAGDNCLAVWSQPSSWTLPTMGLDTRVKLASPLYLHPKG